MESTDLGSHAKMAATDWAWFNGLDHKKNTRGAPSQKKRNIILFLRKVKLCCTPQQPWEERIKVQGCNECVRVCVCVCVSV